MTTKEFSEAFDVALHNYNLKSDFGDQSFITEVTLDEYEKSFFLTKAQDELVTNLYNGKNIYGDFFESTEEMRRYLDVLVVTDYLDATSDDSIKLQEDSSLYKLPPDVAFLTLEQVVLNDSDECINGSTANVYPVTHDEYARVKDNPFRGPTKYKVIRIDHGNNTVELISKYTIGKYLIKYIKQPEPIILVNLTNTGLTIKGIQEVTECKLHKLLHNLILDRAVTLAIAAKNISTPNTNNRD